MPKEESYVADTIATIGKKLFGTGKVAEAKSDIESRGARLDRAEREAVGAPAPTPPASEPTMSQADFAGKPNPAKGRARGVSPASMNP